MTDHQKRIFLKMIESIDDYHNLKIKFSYLVANLEGLFEATEIKNKEIIDNWYNKWTPLEIINGVYSDTAGEPPVGEVEHLLTDFLKFLRVVTEEKIEKHLKIVQSELKS